MKKVSQYDAILHFDEKENKNWQNQPAPFQNKNSKAGLYSLVL